MNKNVADRINDHFFAKAMASPVIDDMISLQGLLIISPRTRFIEPPLD